MKTFTQFASLLLALTVSANLVERAGCQTVDPTKALAEIQEKPLSKGPNGSHRMEEIRRIADRVTVIRNGHNVMTSAVAETSLDAIVEQIVGRRIGAFERQARTNEIGPEVFNVSRLTAKPRPIEATLTIRAGEIVGIAGLMGSGRSSLARAIFGMQSIASGEIRVQQKVVKIDSPPEALDVGIAMIPEDRLTQGLVLQHSVADNMTMPTIDRLSRFGDALAKFIGEKGTVLEARGSLGSEAAELRHKGFNDRIKAKYPNITVKPLNTEWVADTTYKMVLDSFTANPDIKGVFCHNDEMGRGVVSALRQIKRLAPLGKEGHVSVVGLDGTPLALDRIREGTEDASVGQDPYAMGGAIIDKIIAHFEGKPFEEKIGTEPGLITKENVDDPNLWGNAAKKKK